MTIKVRQFSAGDAAQVDALLVRSRWTGLAADLRREGYKRHPLFVAEDGTTIVGVLEGRFDELLFTPEEEHVADIANLVVDASERRRGAGSALVRYFAERALAEGRTAVSLSLHHDDSKDERVAFFRHCGFEISDAEGDFMRADLAEVVTRLPPPE